MNTGKLSFTCTDDDEFISEDSSKILLDYPIKYNTKAIVKYFINYKMSCNLDKLALLNIATNFHRQTNYHPNSNRMHYVNVLLTDDSGFPSIIPSSRSPIPDLLYLSIV